MKELYKALIATSTDRLKNPFIGSFFISWILFNWRPIFLLVFSDKNIEEKILVIDKDYTLIWSFLWLPLIFSVFYLLVLPYLTWFLEFLSTKANLARKENQISLEIFNLNASQRLAIEESKLEDIKANYREKADMNKQVEELNNQLQNRNETIENLKAKTLELNEKLNQMSIYIKANNTDNYSEQEKVELEYEYEKFKETDLYDFFKEIGSSISRSNSFPKNVDNLLLEKYKYSGILEERVNKDGGQVYYLFSKKGRYFWKEYILNTKFEKKKELTNDDLPF